jgi:hypothetical protein
VKSTGEKRAEKGSYNRYIGIAVAPTWGDLARWTNAVRSAATNAERLAVARDWAAEVNARLAHRHFSVKPGELIAFTETVLDLLERKFEGKPIAADANKLVAPMRELVIEDQGKYLRGHESRNVFWAFEYYFLFSQLQLRDSVWWKAVDHCENEACGRFFIRHRVDNRFDSDKCRQNAANRKYYRRHAPSHGGSK